MASARSARLPNHGTCCVTGESAGLRAYARLRRLRETRQLQRRVGQGTGGRYSLPGSRLASKRLLGLRDFAQALPRSAPRVARRQASRSSPRRHRRPYRRGTEPTRRAFVGAFIASSESDSRNSPAAQAKSRAYKRRKQTRQCRVLLRRTLVQESVEAADRRVNRAGACAQVDGDRTGRAPATATGPEATATARSSSEVFGSSKEAAWPFGCVASTPQSFRQSRCAHAVDAQRRSMPCMP